MPSNCSTLSFVLPWRICRSVLYLSRPCLTFSAWRMSRWVCLESIRVACRSSVNVYKTMIARFQLGVEYLGGDIPWVSEPWICSSQWCGLFPSQSQYFPLPQGWNQLYPPFVHLPLHHGWGFQQHECWEGWWWSVGDALTLLLAVSWSQLTVVQKRLVILY